LSVREAKIGERYVMEMPEEFCPERVIGKPCRDGMLPYGGGFSLKTGRIVFATSRKEHERIMAELRALA
jgi:hypothetical protein